MKRKAHTQKNTLLKNAKANAEGNFFKRVFFSPTQEEFYFFSPTLRCFIFFSTAQPTTDKHFDSSVQTINRQGNLTRKTERQQVTAPWQKSGFSGYINICASNKHLRWLDSFVLLSPLLRQAANRQTV